MRITLLDAKKVGSWLAAAVLSVTAVSAPHAQDTRESAAAGLRTVDPKEMDPDYKMDGKFAQKLVDEALTKHPEVILLAIHAGAPKYDIVASNFGRIGKLADEDDLRVIRKGTKNLEMNKTGTHFEDELPLKTRSGKTIGAIGVVFNFKPGDDKAALDRIATEIQKEMQAQLTSSKTLFSAAATAGGPAPERPKNWSPPAAKLYVQRLTEQIMAENSELISVTFHGVPPGAAPKTYTMFGGSYPDRIGNPDDPDDVMVIETGVTLLDPRWHRTKDAIRKFVVQTPLRDSAGENVGLIVLAYKNPVNSGKTDQDFFLAGTKLRDDLERQIPSFAALFEPAK